MLTKQQQADAVNALFKQTKELGLPDKVAMQIRSAAGLDRVDRFPGKPLRDFTSLEAKLEDEGKLSLSISHFTNLLTAAAVQWLQKHNFDPEDYKIKVNDWGVHIFHKEKSDET